jgi:hypothetical protein
VSTNKAVLAIVMGTAFIVLGLTMKQFYAARGIYGAGKLGRPIARWKGRLLFLVIGIAFCLVGIAYFVTDH